MIQDSAKIIIHGDPEIADLIPGYLENRRKDIIKMRGALDRNDYETIGYLGHSMRGSGEGYGFKGISAIGLELEQAAKTGNAEGISRRINELEDYIGRIEIIYK